METPKEKSTNSHPVITPEAMDRLGQAIVSNLIAGLKQVLGGESLGVPVRVLTPDAQTISQIANAFVAPLNDPASAVGQLPGKLGEVVTKLDGIPAAIAAANQGDDDYRPATYRRPLRDGESVAVIGLPDRRLNPVVREARDKFLPKHLVKSTAAIQAAGAAHRAGKIGAVVGALANSVSAAISTIKGAPEAFGAVQAAIIDRNGLDESTRLLLSNVDVLGREFLLVWAMGQPRIWETTAVVESILRNLRDPVPTYRPQSDDTPLGQFFGSLADIHGARRGWSDNRKKAVREDLLKNRVARV